MRRASTFNQLYESAVIKETQVDPPQQELIEALPPSSLKWTWGVTLSEQEVLSLNGSGSRPVHSGYNVSLREGRQVGNYSSESQLTWNGQHDDLPSEVLRSPPPSILPNPHYFSTRNRVIYDSLKITNTSQLSSAPIPATAIEISGGWVPASDRDVGASAPSAPVAATPTAIASGWVPASDIGQLDEEVSAPLKTAPVIGKTVKSVDVQGIARNWEHASDAHHALLPGPSGNVVAASWDCASISDDDNNLYVPVGEPAPTSAPMNQQISNYERDEALMDLDSETEYSG